MNGKKTVSKTSRAFPSLETPCFCIKLPCSVHHSALCRVELKRELDGLERAAAPHAVPRSPRRVLRPGVLMRVVDPAVDVSILLRDLYREADIATLIFAAARLENVPVKLLLLCELPKKSVVKVSCTPSEWYAAVSV